MAAGTVSIGFTTFVQTEIKEDVSDLKNENFIDREKISNLQIQVGTINGKLDLLIENFQIKGVPEVTPEILLTDDGL